MNRELAGVGFFKRVSLLSFATRPAAGAASFASLRNNPAM
jgi:hypothetical protein